jgi:hypothetical protein
MKTAAVLACLAGAASAFTAAPSASRTSVATKATVWEDYVGGKDLRGKDFKFDPVRFLSRLVIICK